MSPIARMSKYFPQTLGHGSDDERWVSPNRSSIGAVVVGGNTFGFN